MPHPFIEHLKEDHEKQRSVGENLKEADRSEERVSLRQEIYDEAYPHMEGEKDGSSHTVQGAATEWASS
jgi:hypothetical protein